MKVHDILNWKKLLETIGLEEEYAEAIKKHGTAYERDPTFAIHPMATLRDDIAWAMGEVYEDKNWSAFWWVLQDHNSTSYSKEKSKELVLNAIKELSKSYDLIPLVYTTLPLPSYVNFSSDVWRELFGTNSFKREDYGHIDIVSAIRQLVKEEIVQVIFFRIFDIRDDALTFKIELDLRRDKGVTKETLETQYPEKTEAFPQRGGFRSVGQFILYDSQRLDLQPQQRRIMEHFLNNPNICVPYGTLQNLAVSNKRVTIENLQRIINKVREEVKAKTGKDLFKVITNTGYIFEMKKVQ